MINHIVYWLRGDSHIELAKISAKSARKAFPGVEVSVCTEDAKDISLDDFDHIYWHKKNESAMLANIRAQLKFLMGAEYGQGILFLDADTLVLKQFSLHAHLTATWRDHVGLVDGDKQEGIASLMPYNYGVLGATATHEAIEAFMWMYSRICNMSDKYQAWYGNQLALAELCGARPKEGIARHKTRIIWNMFGAEKIGSTELSVDKLPCEQFNYTPETEEEDVSGKYVLHFKGGRKDMMLAYAKRMGL